MFLAFSSKCAPEKVEEWDGSRDLRSGAERQRSPVVEWEWGQSGVKGSCKAAAARWEIDDSPLLPWESFYLPRPLQSELTATTQTAQGLLTNNPRQETVLLMARGWWKWWVSGYPWAPVLYPLTSPPNLQGWWVTDEEACFLQVGLLSKN